MRQSAPLAALTVAVALILCGTAGAAVTTFGEGLGGEWTPHQCKADGCAFVDDSYGPVGRDSGWPLIPSQGLIVGLNVVGATTAGTMRLREFRDTPTAENLFVAASPPITIVPSAGIQHYAVSMPVANDELIALSISEGASIGLAEGPFGFFSSWQPEPPEIGSTPFPSPKEGAVGFNIEVLPPPRIGGTAPEWVPTTGGTAMAIVGTNFEGATAVAFGGVPATSFTVESDKRIVAVTPPRSTPAVVPISITTPIGTTTQGAITYGIQPQLRCEVPRLHGLRMKAVRRALGSAECELGRVRTLDGATAKTGRVAKQGVKPGATLRFGAEVSVTLKPRR